MTTKLTREAIVDLALRYISQEEIADFPDKGDLFCFMERGIPDNKVLKDNEGWNFGGYALCMGYDYDYESKPEGKWLWFFYTSLNTFPPSGQTLKLQPPHIARGVFKNAQRSVEIKIVTIPDHFLADTGSDFSEQAEAQTPQSPKTDNILEFPKQK